MSVLGTVFLAAGVLAAGYCFMMLFRNEWVYRRRGEILEREYRAVQAMLERDDWEGLRRHQYYAGYMTYDEMMARWWVWDVEKLRHG